MGGGGVYLISLITWMQFLTKIYSNFTKVKICGEGMWNSAIRRWKELLVCQVNNLSEPCFPLTTFPPNPTNREKPQKTTRSIPIGRWMSSIEFICNGIHVPLGLCLKFEHCHYGNRSLMPCTLSDLLYLNSLLMFSTKPFTEPQLIQDSVRGEVFAWWGFFAFTIVSLPKGSLSH